MISHLKASGVPLPTLARNPKDTEVQHWGGYFPVVNHNIPDSKVHGANIWGRQDPGGSHVGPMKLAIWNKTRTSSVSPGAGGSQEFPYGAIINSPGFQRTKLPLVWKNITPTNTRYHWTIISISQTWYLLSKYYYVYYYVRQCNQ